MRALKLASNPSKVAPSGVRPEAQGQLGRSSGLDLQARLIAKATHTHYFCHGIPRRNNARSSNERRRALLPDEAI